MKGSLRSLLKARVRWIWLVAALASVGALLTVSEAQNASPDVLQRALQRAGEDNSDSGPTTRPSVQLYQPALPHNDAPPPSHLEALYSSRAGRPLEQVGYDQLGMPSRVAIAQTGAVPDSYVIGQGDEIIVVLRGQENDSYRQFVNRDGQIVLPKLSPIAAAGRSFGDFRREIQLAVSQAFISTNVFVSLGVVHQVSVIVSGAVRVPGSRIVSAFATPLDAILLSGGISKSGSLRNVTITRSDGNHVLDLYSILIDGKPSNLGTLRDGDRIFVPPLGATIAVAGAVRHPGIYELARSSRAISTASLIRMAGGVEIAGTYNLAKTRLEAGGIVRLVSIPQGALVETGEVLFVDSSQQPMTDNVTLLGDVEGKDLLEKGLARPLSLAHTVGELIHSVSSLKANAYGLFGLIARRDKRSNATYLVPFSLVGAISGQGDVALQAGDNVYILASDEAHSLALVATNPNYITDENPRVSGGTVNNADAGANSPNAALGNTIGPPQTGTGGLGAASGTSNGDPTARTSAAPTAEIAALRAATDIGTRDVTGIGAEIGRTYADRRDNLLLATSRISTALGIPTAALLKVATENVVWVLDEVRAPGPYLVGAGSALGDVLKAAGGASQQADFSSVEVTSTKFDQAGGVSTTSRNSYGLADWPGVQISPLDVVRLRAVFSDRETGRVTIAGEVRYPGAFDITREERLSSLLSRAGGLTNVAYPYGAIFTRKSAATAERTGYERSARAIESQMAILASTVSSSRGADGGNVTALASIAQQLRTTEALGRVMVTADPTVLATKPEFDIVLQPGDTLFVPKRPSSVTVTGEVLSPGSFEFRSGLQVSDYVRLAGGTTQNADEGRTFLVLPDGSATLISGSWLEFSQMRSVPPGSTVVVPKDLHPFEWGAFLKDVSQIMSQLAVTAASLSVLRTN